MNNEFITKSSFWSNLFKTPQKKDTLIKVFQSSPIFKELSEKELSFIFKTINQRVYQTGEYIFVKGDPGLGLFFILEGSVNIVLNDSKDRQYKLAELSVGDFFGEVSLLGEEVRTASAVAVSDTKIGVFFKDDLDQYIDSYPDRGVKILRGISSVLATRLKNINDDFFNLYFSNKIIEETEDGNDKKNLSSY
ncbi:MAG TPA: cyclic nucleotide-binding domain-containing protein [Melioribacteraceae bacterium]|nr:cyclic nucleotide-binding domain-containing protein [Melioribacteraceae bacterium]